MQSDNVINNICWVAYFDILGFENILWYTKEETGSANLDVVVRCYHDQILRYIENQVRQQTNFTPAKFDYVCSSDSFVFFSANNSIDSYATMDAIGKSFFDKMIINLNIPFRGALTIGEFYADKEKNIFVGQGLIDAYKYAEKQDWIGLVLTPNAHKELCETDLNLEPDYVEYDVPVKRKVIHNGVEQVKKGGERLFAYRISKYQGIESTIVRMRQEAKNRYGDDYENKYKAKYENTLEFIRTTRLKPCPIEQEK